MTPTTRIQRRMAKSTRRLPVEDWASVAQCRQGRPFGIVVCLMIFWIMTSNGFVNLVGLGIVQALFSGNA